ncbi:MAG: methylmalonyl-CoA epimerase, partial [Acidobacteria bacterium]|nr:methylmalonyl-CoA epimerase [Acidobacteriota bacterium]
MKVRLDHIGIAVADADAGTAWYRDRLGLTVTHVEQVESQQVRAHFLPAGGAMLELLEATAPTSPIARFLEKRGPGLHHVALAVDDIAAALAELRAAGVRLIDEAPRPGAEGALVAFLHPSAAGGVLVELKQPAVGVAAGQPQTVALFRGPARTTLGDLELISLCDGFFALDGGAMFGTVPRTLWEKSLPPDSRHRIPMT